MSGWYPDPTGRFEYRYHNDRHWTADVSTNGQRYVDPLPTPVAGPATGIAAPAAAPPPDGGGNGTAIASMVCGIVALVIAWLPFIGVIGLVAAVVGLALAIPALRRSHRRLAPAAASPSPGSSRAPSASSSACSASC